MANHQNAATLGVALSLETGNFVTEANKAAQETQKLKNTIAREMRAADKEIQALKYATEDYGKAVTKVAEIERQLESGRLKSIKGTEKAAELLAQAAAYDKVVASQKKVVNGMTEQQKMQLSYQVTDFVTQVASGQNAMIAFMQQGGQFKDSMGGIGNAFKAIATVLTPMRLLIGGVAGAFGTIAYAAYQGSKEVDAFRDSMSLTGRYAGVTYDQLLKFGDALSGKTGSSIGDARDAMSALVASGKFTADSMDSVGRAVLNFARLTGTDAKEAAKQLIPLLDGTASSAKQLNDKYHFLTLAQYKQIEALERQGKLQEAAQLTANAMADSFEKTKRELGTLETAWKNVHEWASKTWDAMLGFGRRGGADRAKELETKINTLTQEIEERKSKGLKTGSQDAALKAFQAELNEIVERMSAEIDATAAAAKKAEEEQKKINARAKAGGIEGELSAAKAAKKAQFEANFAIAEMYADEEQRIEIELQKKIALAKLDEAEKNEKTLGQYQAHWAAERVAKVAEAEAEAERKRHEYTIKRMYEKFDKEVDILERLDRERTKIFSDIAAKRDEQKYAKESLDAKFSLIGATQKEIDITMARIESQKELDKLMRSQEFKNMSSEKQELAKKELEDVLKAKEANIELAESLQRVQGVYDAVWGAMSSAIENFVRTGKLSIKDFTRSVIQDMLIMQMKLQAMTLVRGLIGSITGMFSSGIGITAGDSALSATGADIMGRRATGGPVSGGSHYLVGEQGPEIFMPSGSGTIIPNDKIAMGSSGPSVVYNGPYIANMSAIDTQSASQFLAKNKSAVWAANQSAQRSLPVSR
jgi:phage-related minor tail protein